jgi:ABC-type oligopeptide transport system substrate-binding subunit
MNMMNLRLILLVLLALGGLSGCAKDEGVTQVGPADATNPQDPNQARGGQVFNDPNQATGQGFRIAPADPNDPNFKPDPKLAGGN